MVKRTPGVPPTPTPKAPPLPVSEHVSQIMVMIDTYTRLVSTYGYAAGAAVRKGLANRLREQFTAELAQTAPATSIQHKDVMSLIEMYGNACRAGHTHLANYERGQLLAALALDDARFAMAAKVFRSQGGTVCDDDIRRVLDECIAEEKRNQRPRIVWGKETRLWQCLGPGETIGYGNTPLIAFYNWQNM